MSALSFHRWGDRVSASIKIALARRASVICAFWKTHECQKKIPDEEENSYHHFFKKITLALFGHFPCLTRHIVVGLQSIKKYIALRVAEFLLSLIIENVHVYFLFQMPVQSYRHNFETVTVVVAPLFVFITLYESRYRGARSSRMLRSAGS